VVYHASFSRDGKRVVTASRDKTARVWDAVTGKPITQPLIEKNAVHSAWFSPDGEHVVVISSEQDEQSGVSRFAETASLWEVKTEKRLKSVTISAD
jgi:hypothetical protein